MDSRLIVERSTILRGTVGSTVHGLHHGGQDDRDEMAVFVEPPEYLLGLRLARRHGVRKPHRFEHWVERTQPEGARSGPGDLDLVAYSLRKYVRLALKGHPTILLLLFVPDELVLVKTELGEELRAMLELPFEHVLVSHGEPVHTREDFVAALEREPWSG